MSRHPWSSNAVFSAPLGSPSVNRQAESMESRCRWAALGGGAARTSNRSAALLVWRNVDRNCRSRQEVEMNGADRVDDYGGSAEQVEVGARGHACADRRIDGRRAVVNGDESLVAAGECDRIAAVVPPVIDVTAGHDVAETDHVLDVWIAVLAHPLADGRAFEARRAGNRGRPPVRVGRRTHRIAGGA